jgi:hypothetical protein
MSGPGGGVSLAPRCGCADEFQRRRRLARRKNVWTPRRFSARVPCGHVHDVGLSMAGQATCFWHVGDRTDQVRGDARTGGTSTPRGLGRCPPRSSLRWDPCSRDAGRGCRHVRRELPRTVTGAVRVSIPGPAATCGRAVRARVRCALREGRLSSFWRGGVALTSGYQLRSIGTRSRSRRGRRRLGRRGGVRGLRPQTAPGRSPGRSRQSGFPGSTGSPRRVRSPRRLRRTR